jgi:hypothetical protein
MEGMVRKSSRRNAARQLRSHLLAILAAAMAGNLLFALTGGFPPFGVASASSASHNGLPVTVSDMHFTLEATDPSLLSGVTFAVATPNGTSPSQVEVLLNAPSASRFTCSKSAAGDTWSCALPGLTMSEFSRIQVLAS